MSRWVVQSGRWLHRERPFNDERMARAFYQTLVEGLVRRNKMVSVMLLDPKGNAVESHVPAGATMPEVMRPPRPFVPGDAIEFARAVGMPWQRGQYVRLVIRGKHDVRDTRGSIWTVESRRLRKPA